VEKISNSFDVFGSKSLLSQAHPTDTSYILIHVNLLSVMMVHDPTWNKDEIDDDDYDFDGMYVLV
jgi:hypothetical protein